MEIFKVYMSLLFIVTMLGITIYVGINSFVTPETILTVIRK